MKSYTPLHLHTFHSLLDGLNSPEEYVKRAKELDMTHVSITDHGTMSGHREHQRACADHGIVPILGVEAYLSATDRFDKRSNAKRSDGTSAYNHVTLLAQDQKGIDNLYKMGELAWSEGYYMKPRVDRELLEQYSEGLIVLSGCLNGVIAKAIEREDFEDAHDWTDWFTNVFQDKFFIEVQSHNPPEMNHALLDIADKFKIQPVMASDCHYAKPEDLWAEEAMLILSTNPNIAKDVDRSKAKQMDLLERFNYLYPDRKMTFQDLKLYLRTLQEEQEAFAQQDITRQDIYDNTNVIAQMVGEYSYHSGLDVLPMPKYDPNERLEKLAFAGLKKKDLETPEYVERLEHELDVIQKLDQSRYFLVLADMISWAVKQGIRLGPARGSAGGSLVTYVLGITNVDPIKYDLLFARFLDLEREDNADVDIDLQDTRRNEVKDYLQRKFKHVASISTFTYFSEKGVIRDASRAVGVPLNDVNRVLKLVDTYDEYLHNPDTEWFRKEYPEVQKLADYLRGRIRSSGMHAAGIIVADKDISNYAPVETRKDTSSQDGARIPVVSYDMAEVEKIGLIKIDLLGLKTLSVIDDALNEIKRRHNKDIDLLELELNDPVVFRDLSLGLTQATFQAEAAPYTSLLKRMGVDSFEELVASNALVRPGAMKVFGSDFIARKQGRQSVISTHPIYDDITKNTYGFALYQEQIMRTCVELAGMSWGDANKVRRIIGKKKDMTEFEAYREKFVTGASQHVHAEFAEKLWHDFEQAAAYLFNRSHAVAYSMLTYWTAWLKHYYPLEFMYAALKNEKDKEKRTEYLIDAKRIGLRVMLPHVNRSDIHVKIYNDALLLGLADIKFISDKLAQRLIDRRPFNSYQELLELSQTPKTGITSRMVGSLNKIGAAAFTDNPLTGDESDNYYEYLNIPKFNSDAITDKMSRQFSNIQDFDEVGEYIFFAMVKSIKRGDGWSRIELVDETGSVGVFHKEHTQICAGVMYVLLVSNNRIVRYIDPEDMGELDKDPFVRYLSVDSINIPDNNKAVLAFSGRKTKTGKNMATVVMSNKDKKLVSAVVFPKMYPRALGKLRPGTVVDVSLGTLEDGSYTIRKIN